MYIPTHFKEERIPVLQEAVRQFGFATLVTYGTEGLEANHLPLLMSAEPAPLGTLHGHLARGNPQWRRLQPGIQALAIFQGPNAYISPSWYPTKLETGKVVPTWNYITVHAYGEIAIVDDPVQLRDHVGKLTEAHEAARPAPWSVSDAPSDYIDQMLRGIVGIKLVISRIEGKWKLSQNRSLSDIAGVQQGLTKESGAAAVAMAAAMAKSGPS